MSVLQSHDELNFYTHLPTGGYLLVPSALVTKLNQFRQLQAADLEAGGVLLGLWRGDASLAAVTHAELTGCTVPSKKDRRSRYGFVRQGNHHLQQVQRAWEHSQGILTYMGEWHTHPERHPQPSAEDVRQWRRNLNSKQGVLIIVGMQSNWIAYWDGENAIPLPELTRDIEF